jgi:large subunit ribosomal protein L6
MSRIGKSPVAVPAGVEVAIAPDSISIKGPLGTAQQAVTGGVAVEQEGNELRIKVLDGSSQAAAMSGTLRALVSNMVTGVTTGFEKTLEIVGTGYRVAATGSGLEFQLGFSHPVVVTAPEGISFAVESAVKFKVQGIDKQQVGEVAANIRKLRKPEPYKGKGVRYEGEVVRRKAGKAGKK